jgi:hypothetical protein
LEGVLKKGYIDGYHEKKKNKMTHGFNNNGFKRLTMGLIPIPAHAHQHQTSCPF